ncbi:restriction endonuclease subunit S [Haemophilus influenzae]|uniref:restriction endonuclease subunit S n=1 Tax=Haemophilus influenzae TaxID=727 RepID=UPI00313EE6C7
MKNNRTFLEKLLDGAEVEWKSLGKVTDIKTGQSVSKNIIAQNSGIYPVINSGREPLGFINEWNTENDPIGITTRGAGVGSITWQEGKYFRGNLNYSVTIKSEYELNVRFLYHVLLHFQKEIHNLCSFTGIPALNASELKKLEIPIPPLSVQTEIVKILDALTALTSELTSELILRQKQYEYYREKLLSFDSLELSGGVVQWIKLIDLGELIRGNGLQKKDFTETGVPAIHYGQIYTYYDTFATKTKSFVSPELAKKLKKAKYGDVLIAGTSENLKDVMKPLGWLGSEIAFSGDMFAFRPNKRVNTKYLTYILQTERFYKFKEKYAQGTKVIRVKADNFLNYEIPLPTFEEQHRIVSILDKFETLTNSITEGLPLAIEQRQKRYEYYRELLLNFKQ